MLKKLLAGFVFSFLIIGTAFAATDVQLIAEVSQKVKDVSISNSKISMVWDDVTKAQLRFQNDGEHITFHTEDSNVVLNTKTFAYYVGTQKPFNAPHSMKSSYAGTLATGATWETKHMTTNPPVTWCPSSLDMMVSTSFEVGDKESYSLLMNGAETTVEVFPIYERGWWTRCVSGKITRKTLFSPALNMVLVAESVMYSPHGHTHTMFMIRVKEIVQK